LAEKEKILIICGHYKGIDERIRQKFIDEEISLGNYVLTGGELPAMCIVDSIARLLPGTLGNNNSLKTDSFFNNNQLGWPVYTRPEVFDGMRVPDVLLSGHHKKIEHWRKNAAIEKTRKNRPELLDSKNTPEPSKNL
jgi:tRNA (guanine37-N1)-methyltransferase